MFRGGWKEGNSVVMEEFPRILCQMLKLLDIAVQCKGTTNVPLPTSTNGFGLVYSFMQSKRTVTGSGENTPMFYLWISKIYSFRDLIIFFPLSFDFRELQLPGCGLVYFFLLFSSCLIEIWFYYDSPPSGNVPIRKVIFVSFL